jgi:acyl-CoA reductase-like NAD-dependent aldehyde dehydrogenase
VARERPVSRQATVDGVAEMMEGRRPQFAESVAAGGGLTMDQAERVVDAAIDRWVWYSGMADKLAQIQGACNPVAGPYADFSVPEPTGVVALLAPRASSLLGLVSVIAPRHRSAATPSWRRPASGRPCRR